MTEMESDTDTMSPANIKTNQLCLPRTSDMCYLSPFSSVGRGDRTISDESNLSSSGYSSMASPAPSRYFPHQMQLFVVVLVLFSF